MRIKPPSTSVGLIGIVHVDGHGPAERFITLSNRGIVKTRRDFCFAPSHTDDETNIFGFDRFAQ